MAEGYLGNSSSNASSSGLKHQKQFPLPALSKEENRFFQEAPPQKAASGAASYRIIQYFRSQSYRPSRPFSGRGETTAPFTHVVNPSKPLRNPPAGTGMSLELSLMPTVSKQHIGSRISEIQQNTTTSLFLTLNIQISHHLQIARLIEAGGVWTTGRAGRTFQTALRFWIL